MNELLDAALAYARRWLLVVPLFPSTADGGCSCRRPGCDSPGKHPRTLHGLDDATTDEARIRRWWGWWPDSNIGLRTGTPGGIVAIDIDTPEAADALNQLRDGRELGGLVIRTGRGWQVWYQTPEGVEIRGRAGTVIHPGIDIRGHRGYVVAPPSLHATGTRYRILRGELCPMPPWMLETLTRPAAVAAPSRTLAASAGTRTMDVGEARLDRLRRLLAASSEAELEQALSRSLNGKATAYGLTVLATACARVRDAEIGERHTVLNKSAYIVGGYLAVTGLDRDAVVEALSAAAEIAFAPAYSEADQAQSARAIERGLAAGEACPRPIPERAA